MIQKTLGLASAVVVFASSLMLAQEKNRADEPKSEQQSRSLSDRLPLEIKGDRIGETVEQFLGHFPNATCKDESAIGRACTQQRGVSLAGVLTDDSACEHHTYACERQGVKAFFQKGHLKSIVYRFYGPHSYRTFCDAFAAKYGRPDHDYDQEMGELREEAKQYGLQTPRKLPMGCSWQQGNISLSVSDLKVAKHDMQGGMIMLSDDTPSKDI